MHISQTIFPEYSPMLMSRYSLSSLPVTVLLACLMLVGLPGLVLAESPAVTEEKPAAEGDQKPEAPRLPGITIDPQKRFIDIEAKVVMRDEAALELIACMANSKEHESVFSHKARPMHIHLALIMIGAEPGRPGFWHVTAEKTTKFEPTGDRVKITILFQNEEKKWIERPVSDYIWDTTAKKTMAPTEFIFAGSKFTETESGRRIYEADVAGNVISLVTFGDELLALPKLKSHQAADGELIFIPHTKALPEVGTDAIIRITPVPKPKKDEKAEDDAAADDAAETDTNKE